MDDRYMQRQVEETTKNGILIESNRLARVVPVDERFVVTTTDYRNREVQYRIAWVEEMIWLNSATLGYQVYTRGPLVKRDGGDHAVQSQNRHYYSIDDMPAELRHLVIGPRALIDAAIVFLQKVADDKYPQA